MANDSGNSEKPKTPFEKLQFRVAEAHWRWKVWKQLYMDDPAKPGEAAERIKLQDSTAPVFFAMLRQIILQDVVLRLCKLVDAEEGGPSKERRRNFSLRSALVDAQKWLSPTDAASAKLQIDKFYASSTPFIKWRHWDIAHDDYNVAIGAQLLPDVTDTDIDRAMNSAVEIMKLLDPNGASKAFMYDHMISTDDGDSIIYALRCAKQYNKERVKNGLGHYRP